MKRAKLCLIVICALLFAFSPAVTGVSAESKTILCVGDSITWGSGSTGSLNGKQSNTYPQRLGALLNNASTVINYGVSGLSVLPDPASNRVVTGGAINDTTIRQSLNRTDADIVLLMLGTNDAKITEYNQGTGRVEPGVWDSSTGGAENFKSAYRALVRRYLDLPSHPTVYCIVPTPCLPEGAYGRASYRITERILRSEISPCIRSVANELSCPLIDLREVFPDPQSADGQAALLKLLVDCVHPNPDGYARIAGTICDTLNQSYFSPASASSPPQTPRSESGGDPESVSVVPEPEYTLSFEFYGDRIYEVPDPIRAHAGDEVVLPKPRIEAQEANTEFLGWAFLPDSPPAYRPGDTYVFGDQNEILYGIWEIKGPFHVHYQDPGMILRELPQDEYEYHAGEILYLPYDYDLDYDRSLYDFSGWAFEADGEILADHGIPFPASDLTFYAVFTTSAPNSLRKIASQKLSEQEQTPTAAFPVLLVAAGGALVLAAGAVCAVFLIKKRRKSSSTGEEK